MHESRDQADLTREIRNLLLDCRTALRQADRDFEGTPLCEQLDDILVEMARSHWSEQMRTGNPAEAGASMSQRVAYTWQSVARELRRADPERYEQMAAQVMQRLDVESLDDPADEIQDLRDELHAQQAHTQQASGELAMLRAALAEAVPLADVTGCSDAELDQRRLQALLQAIEDRGGLPRTSDAAIANAGRVPDRAALQAVAAGQRQLNDFERDWCISEAMVLTGFEQTPVQLLEHGEAALARLILDGPAQTAAQP